MPFTAKDVQGLRQATGAGMMDAKRALEANDGDIEAAMQWLREKGLAATAKRDPCHAVGRILTFSPSPSCRLALRLRNTHQTA